MGQLKGRVFDDLAPFRGRPILQSSGFRPKKRRKTPDQVAGTQGCLGRVEFCHGPPCGWRIGLRRGLASLHLPMGDGGGRDIGICFSIHRVIEDFALSGTKPVAPRHGALLHPEKDSKIGMGYSVVARGGLFVFWLAFIRDGHRSRRRLKLG